MRLPLQSRAFLLLLLSCLIALTSCSGPAPEPQPTPTPARPDISTVTEPEVIWTFQPDEGVFGVQADGDTVYTRSEHSLFALDASSGQEKWHFDPGADIKAYTVRVHQGTAYVATDAKKLLVLDPTSGNVQRATDLPEVVQYGPVGAGDLLCMNGQNDWQSPSYLFCVDRNTGAEKWRLDLGKDPAFLSIVGDTIFVIASQTLYALDLGTGKEKWKYTPGRTLSWGLHVDGGAVYVRGEQTIYAVDATTGQEMWTHRLERQIASDIPVVDGTMYFQSGAALHAMDTGTRAIKWQTKSDDAIGYLMTVRDGILYVGGDNFVHAFDTATGAEKWRLPVKETDMTLPVIANGLLYIAGDYGEHYDGLYAIGGK